jgi:hypothetical protein
MYRSELIQLLLDHCLEDLLDFYEKLKEDYAYTPLMQGSKSENFIDVIMRSVRFRKVYEGEEHFSD